MLQGDYMVLSYTISTFPKDVWDEIKDNYDRKKVKVVLAPNDQGVYIFKHLYQNGEVLADNEIIVNGKQEWDRVYYGIEHYFIAEGSGTDLQQKVHFANVRVSASGDAMLESLSEK